MCGECAHTCLSVCAYACVCLQCYNVPEPCLCPATTRADPGGTEQLPLHEGVAFLRCCPPCRLGLNSYSSMQVCCHFSRVCLFATLWTVAHQAPLSMGFSRQEYQSGLSCPPPGDLPHPGIEPASLISSAMADGFFTTSATQEAQIHTHEETVI